MARIVTKFGFLKQGSRKKAGTYASYIATREGVEKIDDSKKYAPATKKQMQFIEKLESQYPDMKTMLEYEDFWKEPTIKNASELTRRIMEEHAEEVLENTTYADYIATRPRVEKMGSHGLFTDHGIEVNLRKVSEELNHHEGKIWTMIVSMRREDASRLGFDSGNRWRELLRSQTKQISESFKIPMGNLKWYAAFHNESHHPHVHMIVYSKDEKEGYLTKQGIEKLRSSLARELFAQDLYTTYFEKTRYRNALKQVGKDRLERLLDDMKQRSYENEKVEVLLRALAQGLTKHKGKKVYAYLKPELKNLVDEVVEEIGRDARVKELYNLWYEKQEEVLKTYSDAMPLRLSLSQNPEFRSLKNMVIEECANLNQNNPLTVAEKAVLVSESSVKIFRRFGEVFADTMKPNPKVEHSTDRKLKQRLEEKKQAQGLR